MHRFGALRVSYTFEYAVLEQADKYQNMHFRFEMYDTYSWHLHETAREFRETIEAPFFRYYLHGQGEKPVWTATPFQSGANRWRTYAAWSACESARDAMSKAG
jgi:hypothetical protein